MRQFIGADMPLGLLDSGERDADRVVKRKLGQRGSS
jgi:predicted RNase H-like nuclease